MFNNFSYWVGLRYTGVRSDNRLLSFLSRISMMSLVLAVALLIVVMSVMNGFDKELRLRILSLVPHITFYQESSLSESAVDSTKVLNRAKNIMLDNKSVLRAEFFIEQEGLLKSAEGSEPLIFYGMDNYHAIESYIDVASKQRWQDNPQAVLLSQYLASQLMLSVGDDVMGVFPINEKNRIRMHFSVFQVAGIFNTQTELDKAFVWVHPHSLKGLGGNPTQGFRLAVDDLFQSTFVAWELMRDLPEGFYFKDWSQTHGNLYEAVQMSRSMVSLLMFVIIAVAVFNVVSTLMLVVMEKKQSIAILRVMGATRRQTLRIFLVQGLLIGLIGSLIGAILGMLIAVILPSVVSWLEALFNFHLLSTEIYPVDYIPSDLRLGQVVWIVSISIGFSLLASLYPAWRGANIEPAQVLRYE